MRKGMQLAVNTLVVLILGVLIVGLGTAMVYKIYDKAVKVGTEVPMQTERDLFNVLLSSNQRIAVLKNVRDTTRGEPVHFPIAIRNELEGETSTFWLDEVTDSDITIASGGTCASLTCPKVVLLSGPYEVSRYDNEAFMIGIDVPRDVSPGEYVFRIKVLTPDQYGELYARTTLGVNVK